MTRVISERLLVRAARGEHLDHGCAEDDLNRLCERRDRVVAHYVKIEDRELKSSTDGSRVA